MTATGFESSVRSIWNSPRICCGSCCWMTGFSVAFEMTCSSSGSSARSLEVSQPPPDIPGWSALCKGDTSRCLSDKVRAVLLSHHIRCMFQRRRQSVATEEKQLAVFLGRIHSTWLFIMSTTLPLGVSTEKGCRQAILPIRFAQGSVACHRVSWIRDIVPVSELKLLWRGQTFTVVPLVVNDTRPRNTSFAWWRRRCVIPRIVIVRTVGLAR